MTAMQTFQILKGDYGGESSELVKTISAKGMNSIYAQYKKYCFQRHATVMVECSQRESQGAMYWSNLTENFYLKQA
jgi:hypothetical protein